MGSSVWALVFLIRDMVCKWHFASKPVSCSSSTVSSEWVRRPRNSSYGGCCTTAIVKEVNARFVYASRIKQAEQIGASPGVLELEHQRNTREFLKRLLLPSAGVHVKS